MRLQVFSLLNQANSSHDSVNGYHFRNFESAYAECGTGREGGPIKIAEYPLPEFPFQWAADICTLLMSTTTTFVSTLFLSRSPARNEVKPKTKKKRVHTEIQHELAVK